MVSIAHCKWFCDPDFSRIMYLLNQGGDTSCIVGGAIRDSLMNIDVRDVDIATTILPNIVMKIFSQTCYKVVPTGIAHGTVKVVLRDKSFDITTLRSDFITDGRHAKVVFTRDWYADSIRRDFTINALYADQKGNIIDYVGGLNDIMNRQVKFIGDARSRIREDYLRILRFFRFFAHYGKESIDLDGLEAVVHTKEGLKILSVERIWSEIMKLLEAKNPICAVMHMRDSGVLQEIFPNIYGFSIDRLSLIIAGEKNFGWQIDPLIRFIALISLRDKQSILSMLKKLSCSRKIKYFFASYLKFNICENISKKEIDKLLYIYGKDVLISKLKIFLSLNYRKLDDKYTYNITKIIDDIPSWRKPVFPLTGDDILKLGITPGKQVGDILSYCKKEWINSSFQLSYKSLLNLMNELVKSPDKGK
ncbi:MAG: CCA tRNA nucleotidyltransferase [Candidatus Liberibacter europaeus]|uniref:CCA tRNA nucleotidyltransferase n=1 Tax=Candidatus Liberibacter europaeus TaxID=744859 RepID=A0A2T4VY16_9HYPH|nr:CCA tRNA nucleotidyltransferase [Candidatus Liberibacter europaeus]PTL86661.1 MAG: CCA tRNA nucleotidyltransferase [Candidatus Liberibacter europaeus]